MNSRGNKFFKLLDRYIGIPVLFILKFFSRKKGLPSQIKSIGFLTVPAIGDVVLLNGFLRDIKKFDDNIRVLLFVSEEVREIAEIMGSYDGLINVNIYKPISAVNTIRQHPVDIFIDTSQWAKLNAILTYFSKSKFKIGFNTKHQYKHLIFDFAPEHSDTVHELNNYKKLAFNKEIKLECFPKIENIIDLPIKKGQVVIHTIPSGYLSYLKEWPEENWKDVIEYLLAAHYEIYFTGSKYDFSTIEKMLRHFKSDNKLRNIAGRYSLKETVTLLKSSQLVISVNTGIMHLASALNCNLIALHGPTDPKRWGPLNKNARIIQSDYPDAPCLNLGFEYSCKDRTGECMKRISAETVIAEIKKFGL